MTDTELVLRCRKGDSHAFTMLVRQWEPAIYNFALRNVGTKHTAEDICQTVFLRVYEKIGTLRKPEKFKQWIFTITHNACRDEFKRRKKLRLSSSQAHSGGDENPGSYLDNLPGASPTPEQECNSSIIRSVLYRALMEIPIEQRAVVVMKQYHNLTFPEIARITKIPENTVKSRLYYGLKSMRKILKQENINREALTHEV